MEVESQIMSPYTNPIVDTFSLPAIPSRKAQGLEGGATAVLYVCGATHLREFLRPLGVTAFTIGITGRRYYKERGVDLKGRRYAALIIDMAHKDKIILDHPMGGEWFFSELPDPAKDPKAAELLKRLPNAEFHDGVIAFRTPPGVGLAELEQRFQVLMTARNLNTFLASADGKARLADVGLPPRTRLCTDYDLLGVTRRSVASELFCVRPQKELVMLLSALVLALEAEVTANPSHGAKSN